MGKILKSSKRLLFSLFFLVLLSCTHGIPTVESPCQSCDMIQNKPFQPEDAIGSMVLVTGHVTQGSKEMGQWVGSGSIVAHDKRLGTLILTAGHVCVLTDAPPRKEGSAPYKWTLSVTDKTETVYPAMEAFVVRDFDACIINTTLIDAPFLNLSEDGPKVGARVSNIAAPFGVFAKDVSLIFEGRYAGDFKIRSNLLISSYTMPAAAGASGSPVLNREGEIIGIISQVNGYFHHIALSPTHAQLKILFAGEASVQRFNWR